MVKEGKRLWGKGRRGYGGRGCGEWLLWRSSHIS